MAKNVPEVDPKDSEQNAFVQDWLAAWDKAHPVADIQSEEIEIAIEIIQGTYDYRDHMKRTAD